jgi:hypothetical protein
LFLAVEPEIPSGVLSEGAGGAAISLLLRKANDIDIAVIVARALGIDGVSETLELYHPTVGVLIQPLLDPADPLSYGRHIVLEPFAGGGRDFLMTEGFQDEETPPPGIEALASTAGLPIAEPVYQDVLTMQLLEIPSVALPTTQNLPEVGGRRPTGALIQFPGRNHHLVSRDAGAQFQVYEFLRTALLGQAYLFPAEER